MTDDPREFDVPLDGAPTWVRALQAALIGIVAGLVLHAILSAVVLGNGIGPGAGGTSKCRKAAPGRNIVAPAPDSPATSAGAWTVEGLQARR